MQGIRDTLGGMTGTTSPGTPLTGENGWTEAEGCPLYTDDDFPRAVQQFEDFMAANPDTDAFLPTGGFPQFVPDANRAAVEPYKAKIADGSLALVVADTLPTQIEQMKEGFSAGQVGQRPFQMGYEVMNALQQMADGGAAPGRSDLHRSRHLHPGDRRHLHREVSEAVQLRTGGARPRPFLSTIHKQFKISPMRLRAHLGLADSGWPVCRLPSGSSMATVDPDG